jgi:hypothetical protein
MNIYINKKYVMDIIIFDIPIKKKLEINVSPLKRTKSNNPNKN